MTDPIILHRANPSDAKALAAIGFRAWETGILPLLVERPGMRLAEERRLAQEVASSIDRIIVADCDGGPAGWCSRSRGRAYIPFLFVAPGFQGQGIGTLLLRRMESMLELEGQSRVQLETPADNVRAVRFYERQGYHILAFKAEGRPARDAFNSVRLEKRLNPYDGPVPDLD
jgi:ribosomal-protein-alanine N-acetyltransferase